MHSNRLLHIILHDSYFKGLRTKLLCDGHTNNTGGNGAGKTSALQLIPIFYGCMPSQVVSRAAGKDNFLEYYLPRHQSMIVFEYQRQDGTCCAVLYRSNSAQLAYRFIKGSASETIFNQDCQKLFDEGKSAHHIIKSLGFDVTSKQFNTSDYAAVLGRTERCQGNRDLLNAAHRFSLCSARTQMRFMGDLTNVLQSDHNCLKN